MKEFVKPKSTYLLLGRNSKMEEDTVWIVQGRQVGQLELDKEQSVGVIEISLRGVCQGHGDCIPCEDITPKGCLAPAPPPPPPFRVAHLPARSLDIYFQTEPHPR